MSYSAIERELLRAFQFPGDKDKVLSLLPRVSNPRTIKSVHGSDFLQYAVSRGWPDLVEHLIERYNFDPNTEDEDKRTPLYWAAYNGNHDIVEYLAKRGANPLKKDKYGHTPLDYSYGESKKFLKKLIKDSHVDAFKQAIRKKGALCCYVVQCLPYGLPRAGKTSLYYRLLDRQPPGNPTTRNVPGSGSASTDVLTARKMIQVKIDLDTAKTINKPLVTGENGWEEVDGLENEIAIFAKALHAQQQLSLNDKPSQKRSSVTIGTISDDDNTEKDEEDGTESRRSQLDLALIDVLTQHIKDGSADISHVQAKLDTSVTIFYTDCGGQPEFLEVLPALVAGPTIFMLAFNLCEPLDRLYRVRYESKLNEVIEYDSQYTVKEVLMQCLSSILSFHEAQCKSYQCQLLPATSKYAKFTPPPTYIMAMGTHRDLVDENEIEKIDECLQECVAKTALEEKGMIEHYTPEKLVIPIDNFSGADGPKVREVFDRIVKREEKGESRYKVKIPAQWLALELRLRQQESSVVTYSDCLTLGENLGMDGNELASCLWFLHHQMGTIRYYGNDVKELENTVITEPSVIFRAVTEFITSTFTLKNVKSSVQRDFHTYGLFKTEDVEYIFSNHKKNLQIDFHQFITLLEHLNILGPAHNKEFDYFLPSALAHAPVADDNQTLVEYDPLLVAFPTGFVPKGVVSSLLACLCKMENWEIECDRKGKPLLFRNQSTFIAHHYSLTMKAKASFLEFTLDYKMNGSVSDSVFCAIKGDLDMAIHEVLCSLGYSDAFQFGFYCSASSCKDSQAHLMEALGEKAKKAKCSVTKRPFDLDKIRMLWFNAIQVSSHHSSEMIADAFGSEGTNPLLLKAADPDDAYDLIRSHSSEWHSIAGDLKVSFNYREELRRQELTNDYRLEAILNKWIQIQKIPPTWKSLLEALEKNQLCNVANEVTKFLCTEKASRTYGNLPDWPN